LELNETDHVLCSYVSKLEADPLQLEQVEKRMGAIEALKKRFGSTWEEVEKEKLHLLQEIERLKMFDQTLAALRVKGKELSDETARIAARLSAMRIKGAAALSGAILKELSSLNLPDAKFKVELKPKPLCPNGTDEIHFLFTANPHLPPMPLGQIASGGEVSRLLFATKVVLAEKEKTECLVLDEIDSNVGGQTAAVLGEKLVRLAKTRQVICVTHFVQVARCADHHFAVSKREVGGRAVSFVERLEAHALGSEYARMIGH
jgi:DNA repair protein RecN (Recombination protein N)